MATPPTSLGQGPQHDQQCAGIEHPVFLGAFFDVLGDLLEVQNVKAAVVLLDAFPRDRGQNVGAGFLEVFNQRGPLFQNLRAGGVADVQRGVVVGRDQRHRIDLALTIGVLVGQLEVLVQRRASWSRS